MNKIKKIAVRLNKPNVKSSYSKEECTFLLKDIDKKVPELESEEKERLLQSGVHYSEMLPKEGIHKKEYLDFFFKCLNNNKEELARYVAILSEKILKAKGEDIVLVSLARAGSPIGVLIRRYLKQIHNLDVPHYSISIIRGKGIDENALCYIIDKHKTENLQFVDGWTGKGAITYELKEACENFNEKFNVNINYDLAVISDPSYCSRIYGTREDILLPSACLNSTVSGLVSRTVHVSNIIGEMDFHGAKYYKEFVKDDVSLVFVDTISKLFKKEEYEVLKDWDINKEKIEDIGLKETLKLQKEFNVDSIHKIKPSLGETTRVLLRRIPKTILIKNLKDDRFKHIIFLAKEKGVEIVEKKDLTYNCVGIIDAIE